MYAQRRPAPDLAGHLRCSWTAVTGAPGAVLPDGCLDLMWIGGDLVVAGPDTAAAPSGVAAGTPIAAVRFRPGAAPAVLGVPAAELRDRRVPLAALWRDGGALERRVGDAAGAADRVAVLEAAVRRRLADAPPVDPVARGVVAALAGRAAGGSVVGGSAAGGSAAGRLAAGRLAAGTSAAGGSVLDGSAAGGSVGVVAELARRAGLSERQLHRRCLAAFGYGAKTLDRVLRLQRVLALGRAAPGRGLAELAAAAGYADQAHLGHEVRALTGTTPAHLLG